jgi:hypothetical protein
MKNGFKDIIGKKIAAVVIAKSCHRSPRQQVFLVFPDGTRFEIYGENFSCAAGLDRADGIADYVESGGGEVVWVYGDASALEPARAAVAAGQPDGSLEALLQRDLNAWIEAKAAVARARGG